jgi:hypothetical protein
MFFRKEIRAPYSVAGAAYADGFEVTIVMPSGRARTIRFSTADSDCRSESGKDWGAIVLCIILCIAAFANYLWWPKALVYFVLITTVETIVNKDIKRWHWTEHQMAEWLEGCFRGSQSERNALQIRCGSIHILGKGFVIASVCMMLVDYGAIGLAVMASSCITLFIHRNISTSTLGPRWMRAVLLAIASPTLVAGLVLQRVLYLRQPTSQQRECTRQWGLTAAGTASEMVYADSPRVIRKYSA